VLSGPNGLRFCRFAPKSADMVTLFLKTVPQGLKDACKYRKNETFGLGTG
jgi:hypothetical protein